MNGQFFVRQLDGSRILGDSFERVTFDRVQIEMSILQSDDFATFIVPGYHRAFVYDVEKFTAFTILNEVGITTIGELHRKLEKVNIRPERLM